MNQICRQAQEFSDDFLIGEHRGTNWSSRLFRFLHLDDVDLDELAVVGLGRGGYFGYDVLGEIGDQFSVLTISAESDLRTTFDLDRLGVVDCEDAMTDTVLTIQEIVRLG